jgi:error-prone DNA polymerase
MTILADADAFGSLNKTRRAAIWDAMSVESQPKQQSLFDALTPEDDFEAHLPPMNAEEEVYADYRTTGLSLRSHPLAFYRRNLESSGVISAGDLSHVAGGTFVKVAGLVLLRQRPGAAKGVTFVTFDPSSTV